MSSFKRYSRLTVVALLLLLFGCTTTPTPTALPEAFTFEDDGTIQAQARADVLGTSDLATARVNGKNGPLVKVGYDLALLYRESQQLRVQGGDLRNLESARSLNIAGDKVVIDAIAVSRAAAPQLLRDLQRLGLQRGSSFGRVVSGQLPIDAIDDVAALSSLVSARPAFARSRSAQSVLSSDLSSDITTSSVGIAHNQADDYRVMGVAQLRSRLRADGSGTKVGILSDSFNTANTLTDYADDIASGDLPPGIEILEDFSDDTIDEGRAMAQLIHDLVPGADLAFATAFTGSAGFANNILNLEAAGSDVIVDDIVYFAQPYFQDGIIAQAADEAVRRGAPYFSSAGNSANQSYESAYREVTNTGLGFFTGNLHDFDPGPGVDVAQRIIIPPFSLNNLYLQWDEPFASAGPIGSSSDVDVYVVDAVTGNIIGSGFRVNIGGDAVELVFVDNSSPEPRAVDLYIERFSGPAPTRLKYMYYSFSGSIFNIAEYDTQSSTVFGHPNSSLGRGIAAVDYRDAPLQFGSDRAPNSFSSLGGTPILFDTNGNRLPQAVIRPQPALTAPDFVDTTFFIPGFDPDDTGFPNFAGTSAAAPNAAAVAALILSYRPNLTPAQVYALMEAATIDMDNPYTPRFDYRFDFSTGNGFLYAPYLTSNLLTGRIPRTSTDQILLP